MRGENRRLLCPLGRRYGTSPRARGKRPSVYPYHSRFRNIPACAGKTGGGRKTNETLKEHPRVRGENIFFIPPAHRPFGTSPRARGKREEYGFTPPIERNIPACAGKTVPSPLRRSCSSEHPRVRGENLDDWRQLVGIEGTSPRARGKHSPSMFSTSSSRNIPACAGKTVPSPLRRSCSSEHPRVRGENREVFEGEDFYSGTSPRTRVKQVVDAEKRLDLGNIPAHAGKTLHQTGAENHAAEHPRARGENTLDMMLQEPTRGTSPRTRGKPQICQT